MGFGFSLKLFLASKEHKDYSKEHKRIFYVIL